MHKNYRHFALPVALALLLTLPLKVDAYLSEDLLEAKGSVFGLTSLPCDVNDDGQTDVLDYLTMLRDTLRDAQERSGSVVYVSTVDELKSALANASAGDEIVLKAGTYQDGSGWTPFASSGEGTPENPIVLRSEDPDDPAEVMCTDPQNGIALYLTGDYWVVQDLKVSTAQKGIVFDNSNGSVVSNCEVYNVGSEGVHFRDGSSYCTIKDSYVHDTGVVSPGYGEGVYVGSYYGETKYDHACDYNTVLNCTFRDVAAEHVDVKELTTGTTVQGCTMYGSGVSGENYADSFVDIQGNGCTVRDNVCYQDGNQNLVDAFQVHVLVDGWGFDNAVYGNVCYFDDSTAYVLRGWDCGCTAQDNARYPDGNTYAQDSITVLD